ncbi:hypothetical protein [Candidatus Coxiella mudrowiae]|uniref:Cytosolic protein n=1 Tax=Candidatus Coxiella mudrowiae TaxID=2054173 RepID=A0ABN4HPD0_9COXI|nr:hypothetical protein [Candidatus Coxiella mudrowiae]AKQ33443.1 hypothetical protein CleRT_05380 [Candidatus Coxiella mudrowiae]AKQ33530.1 hypothetical protein CleRT_06820 [Candidatus Coxiella mudrowiae]
MNHEFRLMIQKYIEQRLEGERMNALRNLLQAITFPTALFKIREKQRELLAQAEIYQHEQQKGAYNEEKQNYGKRKSDGTGNDNCTTLIENEAKYM